MIDTFDTAAAYADVFDLKSAVHFLGIHHSTLRKELVSGRLSHAKLGRRFIISRLDLESWYVSLGGERLFPTMK